MAVLVVSGAMALAACGSSGGDGQQLPPVGAGDNSSTGATALDIVEGTRFAQLIVDEQAGKLATATDDVIRLGDVSLPSMAPLLRPEDPRYTNTAVVDQRVRAIADALGVDGELRRTGTDVSVGDPATGTIEVYGVGLGDGGSFTYWSPEAVAFGGAPCPTLPGGDGSCDAVAGADLDVVAGPAIGVEQTMAALGVSPDQFSTEVSSSSSFDGLARYVVDGVATSYGWSLSVGDGPTLQSVTGPFSIPVIAGDVDLIDLDTALSRLSALHGDISQVPPTTTMLTAETVPVLPPVSTVFADPGLAVVVTTTTTTLPGPVSIEPFPTATVFAGDIPTSTTPIASETYQPPPTTGIPQAVAAREIVDVRLDFRPFYEAANGPWLVPTFVFSDIGRNEYPVPAVNADFFRIVEPPTTVPPPTTTNLLPPPTLPETMPTLLNADGTPVTLPVPPPGPEAPLEGYGQTIFSVLVGRPLGEAVPTLEATGWSVEVVSPGPDGTYSIEARSRSYDEVIVYDEEGVVAGLSVGDTAAVFAGLSVSTTTTTAGPAETTTSTTIVPATSSLDLAAELPVAWDVSGEWVEPTVEDRQTVADAFEVLVGQPVADVRAAMTQRGWRITELEGPGPFQLALEQMPDSAFVYVTDGFVTAVEWMG